MTLAILGALWYVGSNMTDFVFWKIALILSGMVYHAFRGQWRVLFFLTCVGASAVFSEKPFESVWGIHANWSHGFVPAVIYCLLLKCPTDLRWVRWVGVALAAHCLIQQAGWDPVVAKSILPAGRSLGWIGSCIDAGAVLAMTVPFAGPWLPLVLAGLWATGSRGALLGAAFALCPAKYRLWLLPVFLIPFFLKAPKDVARVELWRMAWPGALEKPVLGHGPSTYQLTFQRLRTKRLVDAVGEKYLQGHAHNDILEAAHSIGLLGLLAYLLLVIPMLSHPSLLALFVTVKFNPVGFETIAVAALISAGYLNTVTKKS